MATLLNPYLAFGREAREAMNFYHGVFGGDLVISTFGEFGMAQDPGDADLVMHSQLTTADGHTLMASDTPASMERPGGRQQVSLSGDDDAALSRYWEGLSDGAQILEPLVQAPWGDRFGMLVDRWGVLWMVNIAATGGAGATSTLDDAVATEGGHQAEPTA
ncbi:VOC family protein [Agrococcus sp. HG114]|uniref:VOC family protein n=1 Tax=Agrococcus sp. HG114 TaxID=2969757 RepID=UPI0028111FC6|nr:VOC family protein [Agrococcus sp. HG114]